MKALLIEPDQRKVSVILYNSLVHTDYTKVIERLLGSQYQYEIEFDNGDGLFTRAQSSSDPSTYAFDLLLTDLVFFGNALIASVPPPSYDRLTNCRFTLTELSNQLRFYNKQSSDVLRKEFIRWPYL